MVSNPIGHPAPGGTIITDSFSVAHNPDSGTVVFSGTLRLNGQDEYAPIVALLGHAVAAAGPVVLDLRGLEFLNSSGIAMLSRFVIAVRDRHRDGLTILGSRAVSWQGRSLVNLQRLMPALVLRLD